MQFTFSTNIDTNKAFIVNRSELEGRIEPEYYKPELAEIENKIRSKSNRKLKDYIKRISSGATPSIQEADKYYGDSETGIPFLRVQNLQTNGRINLEDVKYINIATHQNYLKRSQVAEHDLLVKITGVGRMAIASVAPENFIGNTNQHMVVIKTPNKETSEYLANYLNLDIVEKLASRRATGGTRPALDYPALKSIPIIEAIDFSILQEAEKQKQQKESEAKLLLASIDDYLLNELGITLPKEDETAPQQKNISGFELDNENLLVKKGRIFATSSNETIGNRIDPYFYQYYFTNAFQELRKSKYPLSTLKEISLKITSGITPLSGGDAYTNDMEGVPFVRSGDIDINGNLAFEDLLYLKRSVHETVMKSSQLKHGDLMIAIVGATIGQVGIYLHNREANINQAIALIRLKSGVNPEFVKEVVKSSIGQLNLNRLKRPVARANINLEELATMVLIIPTFEKQNEIAQKIQSIRVEAKSLQDEAVSILQEAKQQVEQMILGN